ncbi:MAG: MSHA fimbrial ATPase MshE [Gammaproteobacteria bacterium]|nr:MAG: MSHA fimbrial ATPase MshE [Gammaproteobacteria bacterium]
MGYAVEARPQKIRKVRIGDLLITNGIITPGQLTAALATQKQTGRKLGSVLVESGFVSEEQLLTLLAQQLQIPYIDLKRYHYDPDVVRLIPETHARRFRAIALEDKPEGLLIGLADPTDISAYDELSRVVGRNIRLAVVNEDDLLRTVDQVYRRTDEISGLAVELEQELARDQVDLGDLVGDDKVTDAPVVRLIQSLFEDAMQVNASDIHIEPEEKEVRIRFRLDGVLRVQTTADQRIAGALVSRLKLMAGLDISERRLPQDGRCQVRVRERVIDVRVSTVPLQYGESVVMRLLNQSAGVMDLESLGMEGDVLVRFRKLIYAPHGMVLVTGPTGSGKTTTLYGALQELNRPETKIITVEDPIEYHFSGINQIQVKPRIDLTFARVMRAILRQDPDIILVGEMRDKETMEIGLRAAMTGHLVLSTLHTNDAISTALRLSDMGAEPYLVAASLRGVLAQRLVRRVCESCAMPSPLNSLMERMVTTELGDYGGELTFKRGAGCTHCNNTGYQGRIPVFEFLELDEELVESLQKDDPAQFLRLARGKPEYRSLKRSVIELAARGLTTMDQVARVTYGMQERR